MAQQRNLHDLIEKCDIYFEDALISKEQLLQEYATYCASLVETDSRSVGVTLHTGSILFDALVYLIAALGSILFDNVAVDEIILSLLPEDMVLYKNERYRWRGLEQIGDMKYMVLEQDGVGRNGVTTHKIPYERSKHLIQPYYGDSMRTDGRGIRGSNNSRINFLKYFFGEETNCFPTAVNVSAVFVADRDEFERITKGMRIHYGQNESIGLLDLATVSYYTEGDEYRYGGNPGRNDPLLKLTSRVSIARDLVLDRSGNRAVGLTVMGSARMIKGASDLEDLLNLTSLRYVHLLDSIDAGNADEMIRVDDDSNIFACTKEFLLQHSMPVKVHSPITDELERQVDRIVDNVVTTLIVDGGCPWNEYRAIKQALATVRRSDWNEEDRDRFIINAYSLLNLFTTSAFPINVMEELVKCGKLSESVASPAKLIDELWHLAELSGSVDSQCIYIVDRLDYLYKSHYEFSAKREALKELIRSASDKSIGVIVPKAYYANILLAYEEFCDSRIEIITANRFNHLREYNVIIVLGDYCGKRFDPLNCRAAADIIILLYDCESHVFSKKKKTRTAFEQKLNAKMGVLNDTEDEAVSDLDIDILPESDIDEFADLSGELDRFIEQIGVFDIRKLAMTSSASSGNTPKADVRLVGHFTNGSQILFSEYYDAVVFDSINETVSEIDAGRLLPGNMLVFVKRDDYTKNMVDFIYDSLLEAHHFNAEVIDSTSKAAHWKSVLRRYKEVNNLSYRETAQALRSVGGTLHEGSIRQWLQEDSHIVGPRDEKSLQQIAELTRDEQLLNDTSSFFEACRIVRRQRKEILNLISKAIVEKLSGRLPDRDGMLEIVYENVDKISEILELESIESFDAPLSVPVNLINRPLALAEMEVSL